MLDFIVKVVGEFVGYLTNYYYNQDKHHDYTQQVVENHNEAYLLSWLEWKKREQKKLTMFIVWVIIITIIYLIYSLIKKALR